MVLHVEGWREGAAEKHDAMRDAALVGGLQQVAQRRQEGVWVPLASRHGAAVGHKARAKHEHGHARRSGPKPAWQGAHTRPRRGCQPASGARAPTPRRPPKLPRTSQHLCLLGTPRGACAAPLSSAKAHRPAQVRQLALNALDAVAAAETIAADQATLPTTLQMVATDEGVSFVAANGRSYFGTGGDWARQGWR